MKRYIKKCTQDQLQQLKLPTDSIAISSVGGYVPPSTPPGEIPCEKIMPYAVYACSAGNV